MRAKAEGADIRMVYSTLDALRIAASEPAREVVFFAIGFETTTPPTAIAVQRAARDGLTNFSRVLQPRADARRHARHPGDRCGRRGPARRVRRPRPCLHRHRHRTLPAGFGRNYRKPVVVAGFEPLDVMQAILMLLRQVNEGRAEVENQYIRAVTPSGNQRAQAAMADVFTIRDRFEWRGLGFVPHSALKLRAGYARFDAEIRFGLETPAASDNPACECGAILRGAKRPAECRLFGTACTPETPMGSCMVSAEGACAAHWTYGRFRLPARLAS